MAVARPWNLLDGEILTTPSMVNSHKGYVEKYSFTTYLGETLVVMRKEG